ncbi:MAG: transposase [bacterium]
MYHGFEYTGKELRHHLKGRMKRSKAHKAYYIEVVVFYAGAGEIKLFFSRFSKRSKWHLLVTTDLTLSYNKALKLYNNRWTIEVMFKELKQYLNFGKCQSNDFDAQIADTTISLITYTILSLHKQVVEYIPLGQVFRKWKDQLLESTLAERLWRLFVGLILSFIQIFELDMGIEELLKKIFQTQQGNQIIKQLLIGQSVEPLLERY